MSKAMHDVGCGARRSKKCDCHTGKLRHIKAKAVAKLKRQRKKIAERTGLPYEETLVEIKHV